MKNNLSRLWIEKSFRLLDEMHQVLPSGMHLDTWESIATPLREAFLSRLASPPIGIGAGVMRTLRDRLDRIAGDTIDGNLVFDALDRDKAAKRRIAQRTNKNAREVDSHVTRVRRSHQVAIWTEELPPKFLEALRMPVDDPELIALNHLVKDE